MQKCALANALERTACNLCRTMLQFGINYKTIRAELQDNSY